MSALDDHERNAQAGPSRYHHPVPTDPAEMDRIAASLSNRSKRLSFLSSKGIPTSTSRHHVSMRLHLSHQLTRRGTKRNYEGLDEEEIGKLEQAEYTSQRDQALKEMEQHREAIAIKGIVEEEAGHQQSKQEYVWDVLFENQRGIYLLGKGYFSSRTLLPFDPSAYTLPALPLASASSFSIARPTLGGSTTSSSELQLLSGKSLRRKPGERDIETVYTLDTFQTPSPAWVWITPWMTNMREGTDESGWRYNYFFKRQGWKSHAGWAGWGGWVRRREWVRLRCLNPEVEVEQPKETHGAGVPHKFKEMVQSGDAESIVKALSKVPLDRKKLEIWERWLREAKHTEVDQLRSILADETRAREISRSFTYHSSVCSFQALLSKYDIHLPTPTEGPALRPADLFRDPKTALEGFDVPEPTTPQ